MKEVGECHICRKKSSKLFIVRSTDNKTIELCDSCKIKYSETKK